MSPLVAALFGCGLVLGLGGGGVRAVRVEAEVSGTLVVVHIFRQVITAHISQLISGANV